MTPLGTVVAGLLVVVLDVRIQGIDLLSDPVGWILVIVGTARLRGRHAAFLAAAIAAGAGAVASLPAAVAEPPAPLQTVELVVLTVLTVAVCTALAALLQEPRSVEWATTLRWMDATYAVVAAGFGLLVSAERPAGGLVAVVLVLVAVGIALLVSFLLLLWRHRHQVLPDGGAPGHVPAV